MHEVKRVSAAGLFSFVSELIKQGQTAKIPVSGNSMYPFLRDGIDSVEFTKGSFDQIKKGDIVLIQRTNGYYVMHRVFRKYKDCFYMVGDAQQWIEGPLFPEQLVAIVNTIWRKEKRILCSNTWLRILTKIWLILRPFRYFIFKVYRKVRKIFSFHSKE
ncbi:S24/S26 family peptidase [Dehalobacter sp. CF]|jgi:Peptidase S24-like.|uniref:S24/S26 family peptidase n=1 Tax=Dehalobacter sp. CF TaxID=1131462 RepID=UPI00059E3691|nr:S24/S26 family peptidase [Dehalobacter sp. CF]